MIRKSREIRAVVLLMIYSTSVDMLTENRWAVRFLKLDDLVFNAHFITDINTLTPLGCAYYCGKNIQCRSFFYSKTYQSCRLHNATVFSRDDGVQALSWTFYVFGHINCPIDEGFISYNADLCVYLAINSSFTFADGQKYCGEKMSNVISLQTNAKRNAFKDLMNTLMENSDLHPLIYHQQFLLNTQKTPTGWQWGNGLVQGAVEWGSGQPYCNSYPCNCMTTFQIWDWKMNDITCSEQHKLVCEYEGITKK